MSNEEEDHSNIPPDLSDDNQMFSAEYKDGQLQIVEVSPYVKGGENQNQMTYSSEHILPDLGCSSDNEQTKYLQVLDTGKGLVQLDLLNFTIVKSEDGSNTFQMVSADSATGDDGDTTITCVLSSDDVDDENPVESYVMLQTDDEQDPYMYLQSPPTQEPPTETPSTESQLTPSIGKVSDISRKLTPVQILEKAKTLQKAKSFLSSATVKSKRGRKRKSDLPPPLELLSSPNFKLYLYSCKMCTFKCNAVKEMSAHKKSEHSGGGKGTGARAACLQCARCPYRGHTHTQLMKHVRDTHAKETATADSDFSLSPSVPVCPRPRLLQRSRNVQTKKASVQLDSEEVEAADVLVCGACGFESGDRAVFRRHIEVDHGATTTII